MPGVPLSERLTESEERRRVGVGLARGDPGERKVLTHQTSGIAELGGATNETKI